MTPPISLYKYEAFTAQSLQNLKNQVIYFGSPLKFNDPYDCALTPNFKKPTNDEIIKIRDHLLASPDLADNVRQAYMTSLLSQLEEMFIGTCEKVLKNAIQKFLVNRGVSCFSEKKDNLLMWSHYGGHCKGFCLEFKSSADPFQGLKKVRYKQDMPLFDIVPMLCDDDFDPILTNLYCTKAIDWAYEQEWRVIHSQAGTSYGYEAEALTGVYFGPDMPFATCEIIALILAGQNTQVQLWQGFRSESIFAVEFRPVNYTSYLKRLGQI